MPLSTVTVSGYLYHPDGTPIEGATVSAKLSQMDANGGIVLPRESSTTTSALGYWALECFPNALVDAAVPGLGTTGSEYVFRSSGHAGKTLNVRAVVPNQDCTLESCMLAGDEATADPGQISGAVRFDLAQTLTSDQQAQARSNIGFAAAITAAFASAALTGIPTAPTAAAGTNTTQIATTAFVRGEVAALVASAPGVLDTLDEIAQALNDDPNFASTMATQLNLKANLSGAAFTGLTSVTANSASPVLTLTQNGAGLALSVGGAATVGGILTVSSFDGKILSTSTSANASARNFAIGQLSAYGTLDVKISAAQGGDATTGSTILALSASSVAITPAVTMASTLDVSNITSVSAAANTWAFRVKSTGGSTDELQLSGGINGNSNGASIRAVTTGGAAYSGLTLDATTITYKASGTQVGQWSSSGLSVTGNLAFGWQDGRYVDFSFSSDYYQRIINGATARELVFVNSSNDTRADFVWKNSVTGSGALTERMRLSTSGLSVTGALSATDTISLTKAAASAILRLTSSGGSGKAWDINSYTDGKLYFGVSGVADYMVLSSAGLSVGTNDANAIVQAGGGNTNLTLRAVGGGGVLKFEANGSERARIDTNGNLGLGITPSAWRNSGDKVIQVGLMSLFADTGISAGVGSNFYLDSGNTYRYIADGSTTYYRQIAGRHEFFVTPSGSAGGAISWTDAVRFDAGAGAGTTSMEIYVVGVGLQRVEIGTADSGGTGYRLLRIPN